MTRIWDDRLAEVWADPGKAGAGVVVGDDAVLTACHVVAEAGADGLVLARMVRPDAPVPRWIPMTILAVDADWDIAILRVRDTDIDHGAEAAAPEPGWETPSSPSPVFVRLGTAVERDCEAVGFPRSEVQQLDRSPAGTVRQTEQIRGTLHPAGQGKRPVNPDRQLPLRWMPLDVDGATPKKQKSWGGMSGAGVVLSDGRLAGLVTSAESAHQQRRLYVVPLADVLDRSPRFAEQLSLVLGGRAIAETRNASRNRDVLQAECLSPDGLPVPVAEAGLDAFGVKPAGVPGEPPFLAYVPRDKDEALREGIQRAQREHRMLLIVGGSAGGKSRSAAEAAKVLLGNHRLICPQPTALVQLRDLGMADLGPVVVWLDDVERFGSQAFRDVVGWLVRSGAVVIATIRLKELEALMPDGDLRNPLGEALTDERLVVRMPWPVQWNDQERARVGEHASYPALLAWVADGKSPSAWVVAGPALETRLSLAQSDDERPGRYALVRTVLDWYRTGIAQPMPKDAALRLLPSGLEAVAIDDAERWACESVLGVSRTTGQSLLTQTTQGDAFTVHDYVLDADTRGSAIPVPDAVWTAALDHASSDERRFAVGYAAARQGNAAVASAAWLPLSSDDQSNATLNLGLLFMDTDPDRARGLLERSARAGNTDGMAAFAMLIQKNEPVPARRLLKRAAEAGNTTAMAALAELVKDTSPGQARHWYERSAIAGSIAGMIGFAAFLEREDPEQAQRWYEEAARAGSTFAMCRLGNLYRDRDPDQARRWYQQAIDAGDTQGLIGFGYVLQDSDPEQARHWYQQAAEAGDKDGMYNLGKALAHSDPEAARRWFQRAAEAGETDGLVGLGTLAAVADPAQARRLFEQAAEAGNATAMFNLGNLLADTDRDQAIRWFERAAEVGHVHAMYRLGRLVVDRNRDRAIRWWKRAAKAGLTDAMVGLGVLYTDQNLAQARRWFQQAADAGEPAGLAGLGNLTVATDPAEARRLWERAAEAGNTGGMVNLGNALASSDPDQARRWFQRAAEVGNSQNPDPGSIQAMVNLGVMIAESDPDQARHWFQRAAEANNVRAMVNLSILLADSDPEQADHWRNRAIASTDQGR